MATRSAISPPSLKLRHSAAGRGTSWPSYEPAGPATSSERGDPARTTNGPRAGGRRHWDRRGEPGSVGQEGRLLVGELLVGQDALLVELGDFLEAVDRVAGHAAFLRRRSCS